MTTTNGLVDLTVTNVAMVEAMIRYDSAYKKAVDVNAGPTFHKKPGKSTIKVLLHIGLINIRSLETLYHLTKKDIKISSLILLLP